MPKPGKIKIAVVRFPTPRVEVKEAGRIVLAAEGATPLEAIERLLRVVDGLLAERGVQP